MISRRQFVGVSAVSLASTLASAASAKMQTAVQANTLRKRPNLILFMPDELRADALACFGNPVVKTPNLDRLASEGTRFPNCFVQYPVCGASRCSLLTGWPTSVRGHRSLYYFLRPDEPNLFRYLKQSGYDVFWFGKSDALAPQSYYDSVTRWNYPPPQKKPLSEFLPPPWPRSDPRYYSYLNKEGGDRREYSDYLNVLSAIDVLEHTDGERPFCIFLPLMYPHPPYSAPQGFHNLYRPSDIPSLRPIGLPKKPNYVTAIRKSYNLESLPESVFREIRAVYLGMVSFTDWVLGELLAAVERTQHADDTAVFVLSDHGDYAGDYGMVEKWPSGLEDVLTNVPLIARVPGGARGHVAENMVELFDVMATCLDLANIQAQHTHFARSLLPQIQGGPGDPDRAAFSEGGYNIYEPQCFEDPAPPEAVAYHKVNLQLTQPETITRAAMVRMRTHKLILRPGDQSELYNLRDDPRELQNLYGDSNAASLQHEMERRLAIWYLNTTGIAPFDKDQRGSPEFYPTPTFTRQDWHHKIIDEA